MYDEYLNKIWFELVYLFSFAASVLKLILLWLARKLGTYLFYFARWYLYLPIFNKYK